ncbi:MAG: hypothetical protein AABX03_03245 [Nanoarchaeota archaeon]
MANEISSSDKFQGLWENSRRFRTNTSEVATLFDLFGGFMKSGFDYDKWQSWDHQRLARFVIFDKEYLGNVIQRLEELKLLDLENKFFGMRFGSHGEYDNNSLGYNPSEFLSSEDICFNPQLLTLLFGQYTPYSYYNDNIVPSEEEIILQKELVKPSKDKNRVILPQEATEIAFKYAKAISNLTKPNIPIRFDRSFLYIDGQKIYEVGSISHSTLRIRSLERDLLCKSDDPKAIEGIKRGISTHRLKIERQESDYYPTYKFTK